MATPAQIKQFKRQLMQACAENNTKPMKKFMEEPALEWDAIKNSEKQNVLHVAAYEGAQDVVKFLLVHSRVAKRVDCRDRAERTPLHLAAATGFTAIAQQLLQSRAAVNVQDAKGCTPLQLAVKFDWAECAGLLLACKANPKLADKKGKTAMELALRKSNSEVAQLLSSGRRTSPFFPQQGGLQDDDQPFSLEIEEPRSVQGSPDRLLSSPDSCSRLLSVVASPPERPPPMLLGARSSPSPANDSWFRSASVEKKSAAPALPTFGSKSGAAGRAEELSFRLHFFFDESVKRLEFEVEWQDREPAAGTVKPGGEADRRGLVKGDRIIEIGGVRTAGKGREQLLPALKERPLILKVERMAEALNEGDPYLELDLVMDLGGYSDHGIELTQRGQLLVASTIRKNSQAFAAGLLEGDAVAGFNGQDVTGLPKHRLVALLEGRLQSVTIWRRPSGASTATPWAMQ